MATQALQPSEVETPPVQALQLEVETGPDPASIAAAFGTGYGQLMQFAGAHGLHFAGPPRAIYTSAGAGGFTLTLALPVAGPPVEAPAPMRLGTLPGGRTLRFTHLGPYDTLRQTYGAVTEWMIQNGRMASEADWDKYMPMWEEYPSDPQSTPPQQLVTWIHLPLGS